MSVEDRRAQERRGIIDPARRQSYAVRCSKCGAHAHSSCSGVSGERWSFHIERVKAGRIHEAERQRQAREGPAEWRAQERRLRGLNEPDAGHFNRPGVDPHKALHSHYERLRGIASQAATIQPDATATRSRGPETPDTGSVGRGRDQGR